MNIFDKIFTTLGFFLTSNCARCHDKFTAPQTITAITPPWCTNGTALCITICKSCVKPTDRVLHVMECGATLGTEPTQKPVFFAPPKLFSNYARLFHLTNGEWRIDLADGYLSIWEPALINSLDITCRTGFNKDYSLYGEIDKHPNLITIPVDYLEFVDLSRPTAMMAIPDLLGIEHFNRQESH